MSFEIVCDNDGGTSPKLGASHGRTHLLAEDIGGASLGNPAIKPAIAPIHQSKTVDLPIVARRFDQTLPATSFAAPEACERRMEGELHLIL